MPLTLKEMDGLFVGQLPLAELATFDNACELGMAQRTFEGIPGHLGLATCRLTLYGLRVVERCKGTSCLDSNTRRDKTKPSACACYEWAVEREAHAAHCVRAWSAE